MAKSISSGRCRITTSMSSWRSAAGDSSTTDRGQSQVRARPTPSGPRSGGAGTRYWWPPWTKAVVQLPWTCRADPRDRAPTQPSSTSAGRPTKGLQPRRGRPRRPRSRAGPGRAGRHAGRRCRRRARALCRRPAVGPTAPATPGRRATPSACGMPRRGARPVSPQTTSRASATTPANSRRGGRQATRRPSRRRRLYQPFRGPPVTTTSVAGMSGARGHRGEAVGRPPSGGRPAPHRVHDGHPLGVTSPACRAGDAPGDSGERRVGRGSPSAISRHHA